jgi:ubiquitin-large subunit ribosomal protein L40e
MEFLKTQLQKEHNWNTSDTDLVIHEYTRFLILKNMRKECYPSNNIDLVWTQHILHTKNYYEYCHANFDHVIHRNELDNDHHKKLAGLKITLEKYKMYFFSDPNERVWGIKQDLGMEEDKCILCKKKYDYSFQMRTSLCCNETKICSNCFYNDDICPFCESNKYNSVGRTVQIFLKTMSKTFTINCCKQDTVLSAKGQYAHQRNCSCDSFRFIFAGKTMEDDKLLLDYNINKESTIHVIGRCRG